LEPAPTRERKECALRIRKGKKKRIRRASRREGEGERLAGRQGKRIFVEEKSATEQRRLHEKTGFALPARGGKAHLRKEKKGRERDQEKKELPPR